ncbi:hypothetical protein ACWEQG_32410 [Microbispora sp. NPDC004025]
MAETARSGRAPRKPSELQDVYEFLEEVRLRPGMWVRRSSLQDLDSILFGYALALEVHGIDEPFDFWSGGPFAEWLWKRLNLSCPSALGWAVEIERAAEESGTPAIEMFFGLLGEFHAQRGQPQRRADR